MMRLLISLDEILDTRLGFIGTINPDVLGYFIEDKDEKYFKRIHDSYLAEELNWTYDQWKQAYANRDITTLKNSILTNIVPQLNDLILAIYKDNLKEKLENAFVIDVNTYPYQLSDEELVEMKALLKEYIPLADDIRFVSFTLEQLDGVFLRENYQYVIMYDLHSWMDIHGEKLRKLFMPECIIFTPRLLYKPLKDEDLTPEQKQLLTLDPFKIFETILAYRLRLQYLPVIDFCPVFKTHLQTVDPQVGQMDLDHQPVPFSHDTPDSSQCDPLSLFRQVLASSEESTSGQAT